MIFSHIFAPTCSLEESTLYIGQSQSAIIGQLVSTDKFHRKYHLVSWTQTPFFASDYIKGF